MIGFLSVEIPYPPSANRLWRQFKGRTIKSADYRVWITEAALRIGQVQTITGPYVVIFDATRPDNRRRDLDNLLKAASDALTACKVVEDDSLCQSLTIRWVGEPVKGGKLVAWVKAA